MFGYITVHKPEMKFKDFDIYRTYYCGLCRKLKDRHGIIGQTTLSFDMTFLHILLTGLYEPNTNQITSRCIAHPFHKQDASMNQYTNYVADMNIVLAYFKCMDDWIDEKKHVKLVYGKLLKAGYKKVQNTYPDKVKKVKILLDEINKKEKQEELSVDIMASAFGNVMAEIFAYTSDEWESNLRWIGFYLGKFVYILDAYDDIEEDQKKGTYNPLLKHFKEEHFDDMCYQMLTMMISECAKEFEKLPILDNVEILRNILYAGVWGKYNAVRKKREEKQVKIDE